MPVMQVVPAVPSAKNSGVPLDALGGTFGEQMVSQLHSPLFSQAVRGNLVTFSNATGSPVAIPLFATNATPTFGIFNPSGNTKAFVLQRYNVQFTAGTGIAGGIGYAYLNPAGSAAAGTAAPISTFTAGPAGQSSIVGQAYSGNLVFGISFTVGGAVSALKLHRWSNLSQGAPITSTASFWNLFEDFDGGVIVPPNTLWAPVASVAIAETCQQSVIGYEIPWPMPS